jgi:hydrogenase maturation protease
VNIRVAIAGFGNSLRGDDVAGVLVAEAVASRWRDRVTVLIGTQPLPEWASALAATDVAFFVDAGQSGRDRPRLRKVDAAGGSDGSPGDSHLWGIAQVLQLCGALSGRVPESYVLELPLEREDFSEALSPRARAAAARAIRLLNRRLTNLLR